ncbi:hypothetical protein B9479_008319, partial [Cryptococcus floricola]
MVIVNWGQHEVVLSKALRIHLREGGGDEVVCTQSDVADLWAALWRVNDSGPSASSLRPSGERAGVALMRTTFTFFTITK